MIEIVDTNDRNAVRNMNNIVELHEVMINQRRPEEAVAKFLDPGYIQHDPSLPPAQKAWRNSSSRSSTIARTLAG